MIEKVGCGTAVGCLNGLFERAMIPGQRQSLVKFLNIQSADCVTIRFWGW